MRNYNRITFSHEQSDQKVLQTYYLNNLFHRICGPAVEWDYGHKEWWIENKRHRIDGPAVERANGDKLWFLNDKMHRIGGPAIMHISYKYESNYWYHNDEELPVNSQEEYEKYMKTRILK